MTPAAPNFGEADRCGGVCVYVYVCVVARYFCAFDALAEVSELLVKSVSSRS